MSAWVSRLMSFSMICINQQHPISPPWSGLIPHWNQLPSPGSLRVGITSRVQAHYALDNSKDGGPMTYTVKSVRLEPVQSTAASVKELVIAHIGDSFTSTIYLRFEERLDSLLQKLFAANAPKLKVRNINLGVDGEYLQEMIDTGRYEKAIHQQYARIDVAVIRYGGNDSRKYSPAEFAKWLGVLSDKISKDYPGVKIMIGTGIWLKGDDDVNKRQSIGRRAGTSQQPANSPLRT